MRISPCREEVPSHRRISIHRLRWTVQHNYAAEEVRTTLLNVSRAAPFGIRTSRQKQLEKNLQSLSNCAPETLIEIIFGAQDNHVPIETLLSVPNTIAALIRARGPRTQQLSLEELHAIETDVESLINPLQVRYLTGDHSTSVRQRMLEKFRAYREVLDRLIEKLERDLYGPRDENGRMKQ